MNDSVSNKNQGYIINSLKTNLITGESNLELLNDKTPANFLNLTIVQGST